MTRQLIYKRMAEGRRAAHQLIIQPRAMTTVGSLVRRKTWETEAPWWNSRAIHYLSQNVRPGDNAFEWGSGGSTIWLRRRGLIVTSIEHDPEWAAKVLDRCPEAGITLIKGTPNGTLRSEQEFRSKGRNFFDEYVAAVDELSDESVDVMIVDGLCRLECMRRGKPKIKPGSILVVNDTDFPFLSSVFG